MSKRRIAIATLVAAIVVAVLSGEAFARRGVHHAQFGRRHLHHDVVRNDPPDDRRSARHALLRRSKISDVAGVSRRLDARRCETMSPMGSCQLGTSLVVRKFKTGATSKEMSEYIWLPRSPRYLVGEN
jgi:hypothetical protein